MTTFVPNFKSKYAFVWAQSEVKNCKQLAKSTGVMCRNPKNMSNFTVKYLSK